MKDEDLAAIFAALTLERDKSLTPVKFPLLKKLWVKLELAEVRPTFQEKEAYDLTREIAHQMVK